MMRKICTKALFTVLLISILLINMMVYIPSKEKSQKRLDCSLDIQEYNQDDPCLITQIRNWQHGKLYPMGNYSFYDNPPKLDGQIGVPPYVDSILGNKTGGFYIECGAANGEEGSNTLYFEMIRKWKGLLIEPNKKSFQSLLNKNRNAIHINACLSNSDKPQKVNFINPEIDQLGGVSGIVRNQVIGKISEEICLPLYSILLSIGNPTVDYFSLDVEGAEMGILKAVPWDKVDIKVISIEVQHIDPNAVRKFMQSVGYYLVKTFLSNEINVVQDHVYQKKI